MKTTKEIIKGKVHSTESFGALDGPGIRYVLFLQGCPLTCLYCHNPDSWDINEGRTQTTDEVIADIMSYRNFVREGGVTVSGGEPLSQPEFVLDLLEKLKRRGIHTAIDTSGAVPLSKTRQVIETADMLLLDLKAFSDETHKKITGTGVQNTLETLSFCEIINKPVWIRHTVVPGFTPNYDELKKMAEYLKNYKCVERIDALAFHKMGEYKWHELGKCYTLANIPEPTEAEMNKVREIFKNAVESDENKLQMEL